MQIETADPSHALAALARGCGRLGMTRVTGCCGAAKAVPFHSREWVGFLTLHARSLRPLERTRAFGMTSLMSVGLWGD
jgi:hypothetical protein